MAQKYVDDLSRVTTRGLDKKVKLGWYPCIAPTGYLNSKVEERGNKTILRDPERFAAVRRMWDMMLTGNFSPARIQKIANEKWGFRTRQTKKTGGKPLGRSTIYKIFSEPFYYGRFEYPKGSGQWYPGKHEPMITKAEFNCVQKLLHRGTNPRPQTEFALPFRGLIKCGDCGSSITAHFKEQVRCTKCRYKSSVKNRGACFKCGLSVDGMKNPNIRRYAYYHCTRNLNSRCRQKCISTTALEAQATEKLKPVDFAPDLRDWGMVQVDKIRDQELDEKSQIMAQRKKAYDQCVIRLENLLRLKTAPENADSSLISDEEYQKQRADLISQKTTLGSDTATFEMEVNAKARLMKEALTVVADLAELPAEVDTLRKQELLSALGLNHVLKDKKLEIKPQFPFSEFPYWGNQNQGDLNPIEPNINQGGQGWNADLSPACPRREPLIRIELMTSSFVYTSPYGRTRLYLSPFFRRPLSVVRATNQSAPRSCPLALPRDFNRYSGFAPRLLLPRAGVTTPQ